MRKRPWEIVAMTVFFLLAPFGNIVQASWVNQVSVFDLIVKLYWSDWVVLLSYPIIAFAIYSVRKTGWYIFLGFSAFLIVNNFYNWTQNQNYNILLVISFNVIVLFGAAIIFRKHVRAPYFEPRLRWWETEVRYAVAHKIEIPVTIRQEGKMVIGQLLDISRRGCFLDIPMEFDIGSQLVLDLEWMNLQITCRGKIVRKSGATISKQGYGVMFLSAKRIVGRTIDALISELKRQGVKDRNSIRQETVRSLWSKEA